MEKNLNTNIDPSIEIKIKPSIEKILKKIEEMKKICIENKDSRIETALTSNTNNAKIVSIIEFLTRLCASVGRDIDKLDRIYNFDKVWSNFSNRFKKELNVIINSINSLNSRSSPLLINRELDKIQECCLLIIAEYNLSYNKNSKKGLISRLFFSNK